MNKSTFAIGVALVAMVIAIGGYFYPQVKGAASLFGAIGSETNYSSVGVTGLKVGSNCGDSSSSTAANGCDTIAHIIVASCSLIADLSAGTTTPSYAYCTGVTGVTSADSVTASFATSTLSWNGVNENFNIVSAKASTTAGAIDFELGNLTGKAQAPSAAGRIASTTNLIIVQ